MKTFFTFKNEVFSHLVITFFYFFAVSVFRLKLDIDLVLIWLGGLLGTYFLDIDHLIYWFVTHPEREDSIEAKRVWGLRELGVKERVKKLYQLGKRVHNLHNRLIFHTATFQIILLIVAFYVLTSGGSIFGSAFVMSINLHLLKDEYFDYFRDKNYLSDYLFWQVRGIATEKYLAFYLVAVTIIFGGLTALLR